jgi:hypothetical protein
MNRRDIDIVCFSDIWWDHAWQRHQNILTRFPKEWRVLFIEPTSLPILIKEPKRVFLRKIDNITIVSLPTLPLIDRIKDLRWINDCIILLWLNVIIRLKRISKPILLYYDLRFSSLIEKIDRKLVIYDCTDDKLAFSNVPKWMKIYLDILIYNADIIFVTSSNLQKKIEEKRKDDVFLIGNGVNTELFKKAMTDIPIPEDVKMIKKPIIGYIGAMDSWFDFDIVKDISEKYPNMSIVLLGPIFPGAKCEIDMMRKYHNVIFVDKKPQELLPNYIRTFDICIIPFKINDLTISVNPIKLYEYMASGKNIISTNMPEAEKYKDIIYVTNSKKEFVDSIEKVLYKIPDIDKLLRIAENHDWNIKTKAMVELISNSEKRRS